MTLVNGYVCRDCADEELAKRGIDPAHPKGGPKTDAATDPKNHNLAADRSQELGVNRPAADGPVGARLNVFA